jgi:hypothetical protein
VSYGIISFPSSRVTVLLEVSMDVTVYFQAGTGADSRRMDGIPTVPIRSVVPYLILRSAAVRHSSFDASLMSALLNFVLKRVETTVRISIGVTVLTHLSMGAFISWERIVIGALNPCWWKSIFHWIERVGAQGLPPSGSQLRGMHQTHRLR